MPGPKMRRGSVGVMMYGTLRRATGPQGCLPQAPARAGQGLDPWSSAPPGSLPGLPCGARNLVGRLD